MWHKAILNDVNYTTIKANKSFKEMWKLFYLIDFHVA